MNFRFDKILEDWASIYKPIGHDKQKGSKNKRFFRIKTISTDNEFMRNANSVGTPCMLFSVLIDAETDGKDKAVNYRYMIYFASKSISRTLAKNAKQDDDLGYDQQLAMDSMVQDLLAYLHVIRQTGVCPITNVPFDNVTVQGLKGLMLDRADWASAPVKFNEWHIMGLAIQGISPRLLCVNKEQYLLPEDPDTETETQQEDSETEPDTEP